MAQSNQRRKYLTIVSATCLLIVIVGFTPTIQERMGGLPGRGTPGAATGSVSAPTGAEPAAAPAGRDAYTGTSGEIALPDAERIVQQAQLIRGELAARERAIAAQEDLLRRQVLAEFWKRQAAAAAATLGLSLIIVLVLVRRAADWSGFSQRLREEESRMRNLQLSVIGALEEFESELAAARAWASAEARSRRPVVERSQTAEAGERLAEPVGPSAVPMTAQAYFDEGPAPTRESAGSSGFFFGEDEHVGAATPMGGASGLLDSDAPLAGGAAWAQTEPAPLEFPEPRAQAPAPMVQEAWQPTHGAAAGGSAGASRATAEAAGPESWARRLLTADGTGSLEQAANGAGPWAEPVRRTGPTPAPAAAFRYGAAGPGTREQVERLAAEGCGETEIARRLGLSREEIHLALMLGRSVRTGSGAAPFGPEASGGGPEMMPPSGWQGRRERQVHGISG